MLKFLLLIPALLLLIPTLSAQETPDTAQLRMMSKMVHWGASALYGADDGTYKVKEEVELPWNVAELTESQAQLNAQHVLDHGTLRYEKDIMFNKLKMRFNSNFAAGIEADPVTFDLDIVSSNLTDSLGNAIEAKGLITNFSFSFKHDNDAPGMGHNTADNEKVTADARLKPKPVGPVTGTITYAAQALLRFEKIEVTTADVGKSFTLGNLAFTLTQFGNEHIVLSHSNPSPELKFLQFDANGKQLSRSSRSFGSSSSNLFGFLFEAFEKNPALTKDDVFDLIVANREKMKDQENLNLALVFRRYDGAEKVVIYRPVMSTLVEKTVTVE